MSLTRLPNDKNVNVKVFGAAHRRMRRPASRLPRNSWGRSAMATVIASDPFSVAQAGTPIRICAAPVRRRLRHWRGGRTIVRALKRNPETHTARPRRLGMVSYPASRRFRPAVLLYIRAWLAHVAQQPRVSQHRNDYHSARNSRRHRHFVRERP